MDFKKELKTFFKGEVADDSATLERYSKDASLFQVKPRVVVFPKDAEDISSLASFVLKHPEEKLSLTCRSGGSDMSGGPLSESIVIDMAGFNRIEEIGQDFAIAEPGVFYRDFEEETLKKNLLLPCFPASRELCTLGGMVGNNSGGEKTLSFGKIEDYIEKLNVVLADGKEHEFKPLSMDELKIKMSQSDFEGEVYRKTFQLLEENYDVVKSAKPKVSKNSAGYYLWNVYDRERGTFDLTKLFVGSQGTLGIITKAKFKLIHPLPYSSMLVVFLKDETLLAEVTEAVMQEKPEAFELYDDHTIKLALRFFSDFLKILKGNILSLAFRFLPEFFMFLRGGMPKLVLLAEFSGNTPQEVFEKAKKAKAHASEFKVEMSIAQNKKEIEKYHTIRRESFNLLRRHIKGKRTAPFIDDIIVRSEDLEEFLPKLQEVLSQYPQLVYTIAGHVGDGNLHIIPLMDLKDRNAKNVIEDLSKKVYGLVSQFKGSITAEHNDGIIRTPFLEQMYGKQVCDLFLKAKQIFDPQNIFNPGKKVQGTIEYAVSHIAFE